MILKSSKAVLLFFIMTLKFDRVQAGEYQVNDGSKMVGYIKKQNSAKWVLYKATNPSLLGNPIAVDKTLKALKVKAEQLIGSSDANVQQNLDALIKDVQAKDEAKKQDLRDMLKRTEELTINLAEYKMTEDGLEEIVKPYGEILTDEQIAAL